MKKKRKEKKKKRRRRKRRRLLFARSLAHAVIPQLVGKWVI